MPEPSRSMRRAHAAGRLVRRRARPRRYSLRPGCLAQRRRPPAPGRPRGARQAAPARRSSTGRANRRKQTMAATGLPGRPTNTASPEPAERQRPAGLHRDLPEVEPAQLGHAAHDVVLVAARGAARGEDHVVARRPPRRRAGAHRRPASSGSDAEVGDLDRQGAQQARQDGRLASNTAPCAERGAGLDQLVAGREHGHPQAARTPAARSRPSSAARPISCGRRRVRRRRARPGPARTSSPARRRLAPGLAGPAGTSDACRRSTATSSCSATVSAPAGITAPVSTRRAAPGGTRPGERVAGGGAAGQPAPAWRRPRACRRRKAKA